MIRSCSRSKQGARTRAVARRARAQSRDSSNPPPTSSSDEPTLLHVRRHADGTIEYTFDPPPEGQPSSRSFRRGQDGSSADQSLQHLPSPQLSEAAAAAASDPQHGGSEEQDIASGANGASPPVTARSQDADGLATAAGAPGPTHAQKFNHSQGANDDGPLAGIPPPRMTYGLLPPEDVEAAMTPRSSPQTPPAATSHATPAAVPAAASSERTPSQPRHVHAQASDLRKRFQKAINGAMLQQAVELVATSGHSACVPMLQPPSGVRHATSHLPGLLMLYTFSSCLGRHYLWCSPMHARERSRMVHRSVSISLPHAAALLLRWV